GIKRYPVVFVDDVLIAQPKDFGGWGEKGGKYSPWREQANHDKFKRDLSHMIDLLLRGDKNTAARAGARADDAAEITALPRLAALDLAGRSVESEKLAGQIVVVEFWATWCPPCRGTLDWLGKLERRYGDKVTVVAVAVESDEKEVRQLIEPLRLPVHVVMGQKEMVTPFGDFSTVPTMFVFDRQGKTAGVFYGAPKDLHARVARLIDTLAR
ncbi:MAG TPA: TlpA disulfide reductase family protein, partial [Blastocatellia bacterium]|nr:TlpA disulfide reductase family protein [Blastocatellia bacterium]